MGYERWKPSSVFTVLMRGDSAFLYVTGYDSSIENLALGNVVHSFALRHLYDRGIRLVDFMTDIGPGSYKERWTKEYAISSKHVFVKKSFPGRLVGLALSLKSNP